MKRCHGSVLLFYYTCIYNFNSDVILLNKLVREWFPSVYEPPYAERAVTCSAV